MGEAVSNSLPLNIVSLFLLSHIFSFNFSLKRFKKLPSYKLISNTGPRHKPLFKVSVKLQNTKLYTSEGKSKKDAEQNAAILCLNDIKNI